MSPKKRNTKAQPAGVESSALPFWKLDDGAFEQFCTDWLNFHPKIVCQRDGKVVELKVISASRLGSGTNQRGGDIEVQMESGEVWLVQCKHVNSFGPAKVRTAVKRAEIDRPDVNQYVLVTSRILSDKALQEIPRERWMWWDSSRLTKEVQKLEPTESGMKLVQSYEQFGLEWVKRLFPWGANNLLTWKEFFAQDLADNHRMFHHMIPFVSGDSIPLLKSFVTDGAGKALLLSAGGGQGKSRLLLELAKLIDSSETMSRVRFLKVGGRPLEEEAIDSLQREKNLLLIIEDAHRLDQVLGQVASATSKSDSIRLLVATRPQAQEAVISQLFQNGYAERILDPLVLPRWKFADILSLAERVLDGSKRLHAPRLASLADRCPLLVVLGGALINSGSIPEALTDVASFRERVFKGFRDEFLRFFEGATRERLSRLIRLIALVSPTPRTSEFFEKAAETLQCSALDVAEDVESLSAAGLLAENGEGTRLYPDLFSDAVALDACLDGSGKTSLFLRRVISKLPGKDFPALLRNLAQADWESRPKRKSEESFFGPVWDEFTRRFQSATWWGRRLLIQQWSTFGVYQPERTLELAKLALSSTDPAPAAGGAKRAYMDERTTMVDSLPSMLKPILMWHPAQAEKALDILWQLDSKQPQSNIQSDQSPIGIISSAAEFSVENHHGPQLVLSWLEKTLATAQALDRLRCERWLLPALLNSYFARATERNWSTGRTIHFQEIPLSAERTKPLRDRALRIVQGFADGNDLSLALSVVEVLTTATNTLYPKFRREVTEKDFDEWRPSRLEALETFKSVISANLDKPVVLLVIRRHLLHLSRHDRDKEFANSCSQLLSALPDTLEIRFMRCLTSWCHDEVEIGNGENHIEDYNHADRQWDNFCAQVIQELATSLKATDLTLDFLRSNLETAQLARFETRPNVVLSHLCSISDEWTQSLLVELTGTQDSTLDFYIDEVLRAARSAGLASYHESLHTIPITGRPGQVCALIRHLARGAVRDGGLETEHRESLELCANRHEAEIVRCLTSEIGFHLGDYDWACELLAHLLPESERDSNEIINALARLIEKRQYQIKPQWVRECLSHVGAHCLEVNPNEERSFTTVSKFFPKESYEHIRDIVDAMAPDNPVVAFRIANRELPRLGKLEDDKFIDCEIDAQWGKVADDQEWTNSNALSR